SPTGVREVKRFGGADIAGGHLKETGTSHWAGPNTGASNLSGFTALPGGYRYFDGSFSELGSYGDHISSTLYSSDYFYHRGLYEDNDDLYRGLEFLSNGVSIPLQRCPGSGRCRSRQPEYYRRDHHPSGQHACTGGGSMDRDFRSGW
ncbi:MAG TPA: hypothetical protein P5550_03945, partial [Bacteroidales bacterium]|nr:hypothetical protein [Bacteroidales bacterium]